MASRRLLSIVHRRVPAAPWDEGDNLPWHEPAFSERMLVEHLSQRHDLASRRASVIDAQARFIARQLAGLDRARILDLGCGPGLYLHRLARMGHRGRGIDFSPKAIAYARGVAAREALECDFELAHIRDAVFGENFDLVLLIYGQINVFPRPRAHDILRRAHAALGPGGTLLLEPQTPQAVRGAADDTTDWTASESGLFAGKPHLLLHERTWDEPSRTCTDRWHVVDAETAAVDRYAMSTCCYDRGELESLLRAIGFDRVETCPSLAGSETAATPGHFAIAASRRPGRGRRHRRSPAGS